MTARIELDVNPKLSPPERHELSQLLDEFKDCFTAETGIGRTSVAKHRIITDELPHPVGQRTYRVSLKDRFYPEAGSKNAQGRCYSTVDEPVGRSSSDCKKERRNIGVLRRLPAVNKGNKKDVYSLPRIDDTLDRLRHACYFSIDLKSGYRQIEVDERHKRNTAFFTTDGLHEFKVMPFGLCTAPATFQRVMGTVLGGLKWQTCFFYLDDVVIFACFFKEQLRLLKAVLEALKNAGLTFNP